MRIREMLEMLERLQQVLSKYVRMLHSTGHLRPEIVDPFVCGFLSSIDPKFLEYAVSDLHVKDKGFELVYTVSPEGKKALIVEVMAEKAEPEVKVKIDSV